MEPLSTEVKLQLFLLCLMAAVSEIFKIVVFRQETWNSNKVPEVANMYGVIGPSSYPMGSKCSLFSLYRLRFPRNGPIFKIAIFGHKTWNLKKVPESCMLTLFLGPGGQNQLIFALRASVSAIRADFQNCHTCIWAWTWKFNLKKVPEVAYRPSFYSRGSGQPSWRTDLQDCQVWSLFVQAVFRQSPEKRRNNQ